MAVQAKCGWSALQVGLLTESAGGSATDCGPLALNHFCAVTRPCPVPAETNTDCTSPGAGDGSSSTSALPLPPEIGTPVDMLVSETSQSLRNEPLSVSIDEMPAVLPGALLMVTGNG